MVMMLSLEMARPACILSCDAVTHAMGNKMEYSLSPLPILRPHPRACPPPPFDNSMLCVTFSLYPCPFSAYLFFVVHVSVDTKGNACTA